MSPERLIDKILAMAKSVAGNRTIPLDEMSLILTQPSDSSEAEIDRARMRGEESILRDDPAALAERQRPSSGS